ncbi:nucleotide sugar dehydrogenase [Lysinibacillus sphaericus]|uniref:NDP-N-acetyl-D-galactosaminuronic acid dehydrogenase n=3 Tax=Lysinibacillus TaxID=400634 RepID=A0A2S0K4V6_LYSSH|nr:MULTISPECIES: nucleotide sugar dehydrogenase [Lysinibacillus]AHN20533.1 UDP-N-acetyl-D-mannosamine dehydrogenase [Lysinibacillus varians]AVK98405.1 UDP-N-acetyl-D-mannosamine dehydrogenase [Lysinibacillus sphaericus]MED4543933.1 nucleotide sugar dehydrogenase [Lysinibacillus sphaericus]OEC00816.1 UDP-N-acetyl-D-mannosamine dehydrogenase [Lysinibacillus sphaericus]TKI18399.1 nucleotide sugar dehydrogenase [Lysinibacillus sphaericus]
MTKSICVVGLGYIGLPTAVMFANHGIKVHGVDVNPAAVKSIQEKKLHIEENGLQERLNKAVDEGFLTASTTPQEADVFIVAVPSPINPDNTANLEYVRQATASIVPYVRKGNLVILESTVPPKTVEHIMLPELIKANLEFGVDLFVAHSPERVIPGRIFEELVNNDRIVGGIDPVSAQMTKELYQTFVNGTIHLTDATTAELVKVMENTYRDVNIAFANELAKMAEKLDVNIWEAIKFANYHPRVNVHFPGPGVGGHCIAVDPWFLVELGGEQAQIIHLSRNTNDSMPSYTAQRTQAILNENKIAGGKVAVLGLAFKGNVDDMRESPSTIVIDELQNLGLEVISYDPHIKENKHATQTQSLEEATKDADIIVVLTDHNEFKAMDAAAITVKTKIVFDTKNCLNRDKWQEAGFQFHLLGDAKNR